MNTLTIAKTDEEWKKELSPDLFQVAREKGTEKPFTGTYYKSKESGMYRCSVCGNELFSSDAKYDSSSGWPSFDAPTSDENINLAADRTLGVERTEVLCNKCGSHLGHVFDDGPTSSGKRYCINSISLQLNKNEET